MIDLSLKIFLQIDVKKVEQLFNKVIQYIILEDFQRKVGSNIIADFVGFNFEVLLYNILH